MRLYLIGGVMLFLSILINGCAVEHEAQDSSQWNRDVIVAFRKDATDIERERFVTYNRLEFVAKYDFYLYKYRILTGESIKDFIERLSSDPVIDSIQPADQYDNSIRE